MNTSPSYELDTSQQMGLYIIFILKNLFSLFNFTVRTWYQTLPLSGPLTFPIFNNPYYHFTTPPARLYFSIHLYHLGTFAIPAMTPPPPSREIISTTDRLVRFPRIHEKYLSRDTLEDYDILWGYSYVSLFSFSLVTCAGQTKLIIARVGYQEPYTNQRIPDSA